MREMKFRGIKKGTKTFVFGWLIGEGDDRYIRDEFTTIAVYPETVGQLIKPKYKNDKDVFEGDIISAIGTKSIKTHDMSKARLYVNSNIKDIFNTIEKKVPFLCVWNNSFSSFEFENTTYSICSDVDKRDIEVIGNIHQNPELLK